MNRGVAVLLLLALPIACDEPVLGADVDYSTLPSPSASAVPAAVATISAPPLGPALSRFAVPAFPVCPPQRSLKPKAKIRSAGDEIFGAQELQPGFEACLKRSLHERAQVILEVGILPSGGICGVQLYSSATLSAELVACVARPLHRYRFSAADNGSGIVIPIAFSPTASAQSSASVSVSAASSATR
jgi:hypothetical protein